MSKVLLVLLLAIAFSSAQNITTCDEVNFEGFCASISAAEPDWETESSFVANILEQSYDLLWPTIEEAIQRAADKHGFSFCEDCFTALKHLVCASAVPPCGFHQCIAGQAIQTATCVTETCSDSCSTTADQSLACYECVSNCVNEVLFEPCKEFMISREMCAQFINICGCITDPDTVELACKFFSPEGYTIDFPAGLSCSNVDGWCQDGSAQAGNVSPNPYIALAIPQAGNTNTATLAGETAEGSSGSTVIVSVVLLIAAMVSSFSF